MTKMTKRTKFFLHLGIWSATAAAITAASMSASNAQDLEQGRFTVERSGDEAGMDVILIPGLGSHADSWAETVPALSAYDVHTLNLAGFAGVPAGAPVEDFIAANADAISSYITAQGMTDVALVGHSLGGQVALQVSMRNAEVDQVMAVDSAPFLPAMFNPAATEAMTAQFANVMRTQLSGMDATQFEATQRQGIAIQSQSVERQEEVLGWSVASDRAVFVQALHQLMSTDYRDDISAVQAPVEIVAAYNGNMPMSQEALVGIYESQYGGLEVPYSIHVIEDSAHFIMFDQAEAFNTHLLSWLNAED